jgi:response regulator RpfG family c-di-GMP phosphodiesterase
MIGRYQIAFARDRAAGFPPMSRLRASVIVVLVIAQALALTAGTLLYYKPVRNSSGVFASLDRTWVVGILTGILAALMTVVLIRMVQRGWRLTFEDMKAELGDEINEKARHLTVTRDAVIFGLARLSESRDTNTGHHLMRIKRYVDLLARRLRRETRELRDFITEEWIDDLCLSSALHDIGKVSVPDAILLKPGRLTEDEFDQIKQHTLVGGDCLKEIEQRLTDCNFLMLAREVAYAHHEWWNGEGYPHGLKERAIPLSARIVALADVYDALTTERPYKPAMPHREAVKLIRARRGTQFEPLVVDAFLAVEHEFDRLRRELASEESPRVYADAA